jgi:predicted RNA-binding Zn-ribbon protein involved in translation (DUF1610 family)
MILAAACFPLAAFWLRRRRMVARGLRCWNCGADLRYKRLYVDFKGQSRCPKCGNEMEVTDTHRIRP